jgi:hypothetical protein
MAMDTPEPTASAQQVVEILQQRDTTPTYVHLTDGRCLLVLNIAWGQDFGDPEFHITSNISPSPACAHTVDLFWSSEVKRIVDPTSGVSLYVRSTI